MSVIYLKSAFAEPPAPVAAAAATGVVSIIDQRVLTEAVLLEHRGLVTGTQLDQDTALKIREAFTAFLDAGGHWFFNGHMVRPLVDGMETYRPMEHPKRPDFELFALAPHPIFAGIDLKHLETNKGVAGFYGRGQNPPPDSAIPLNGLGPARVPVDWVWCRPAGGRVFSHAGNDLGQMGLEHGLSALLWARILDWANGGDCLCD